MDCSVQGRRRLLGDADGAGASLRRECACSACTGGTTGTCNSTPFCERCTGRPESREKTSGRRARPRAPRTEQTTRPSCVAPPPG
eukprot:5188346-Pyramimonas_sp.AAC.1